jgi:hypothetical protein
VVSRPRPAGPAPLPHAWIDDEDGRRRPVKDLLVPGRFLLIAGEHGQAWCEAARQLAAEADIPLDALRIGHLGGDYHDPRCAWLRYRQSASDGAIVVRPDRFIAWLYPAAAGDPGPSSPPRSARSLGADRLLRQGRQVPDRRGCCAAMMTVCRQRAPGANVR